MNAASPSTLGGRLRVPVAPWIAALVVAIAGAYGLASLWPPLHEAWSGIYGAFSHGYLALALSIWMGIAYWRRSPPGELRPQWTAAAALFVLVVALVAMDLLFLQSSRLVLLPLLLLAAVAAVFGVDGMRVLLWPTLYLYCALPQWWVINTLLQTLTSRVVSTAIELTQLSAYVEGNFIHVPAGVFEIASGCSGLNYLVAALSLAGFYAFMYLRTWRSRLWLLGVAAALAMLSNFVRVYALIVIGIVTDMKHYLVTVEHLYFGWAIFMAAMIPVFLFARRLEDREIVNTSVVEPAPQLEPQVAATIVPAAIVTALILVVPRVASVSVDESAASIEPLPLAFSAWAQTSTPASAWRPAFVNAREQRAGYSDGGQRVELYRAIYPLQTSADRVVRADNDFHGPGWRQAEQRVVGAETTGFASVDESRGYLNDQERLMWSWYVVAGAPARSKLAAKLREAQGILQRRRDAMAVAIATECLPNCDAARARLSEFTRESAASLRP